MNKRWGLETERHEGNEWTWRRATGYYHEIGTGGRKKVRNGRRIRIKSTFCVEFYEQAKVQLVNKSCCCVKLTKGLSGAPYNPCDLYRFAHLTGRNENPIRTCSEHTWLRFRNSDGGRAYPPTPLPLTGPENLNQVSVVSWTNFARR